MKITLDNSLDFLYQWDVNRYVVLTDIEAGTALHFTNSDLDNAFVMASEEKDNRVICDIPNQILTYDKDIIIFVYDGDKTIFSRKIHLISRAKPDDYIYEETELLNISKLSKEIQELRDSMANSLRLEDNILSLNSNEKELSSVELDRDYSKLENKPQINGIEVSGNKTGEELSLIDLNKFDDGRLIGIKLFYTKNDLMSWLGQDIGSGRFEIQMSIPNGKYYIIYGIDYTKYIENASRGRSIIIDNDINYEDLIVSATDFAAIISNSFFNIISLGESYYNIFEQQISNINNNAIFNTDELILDGNSLV